MATTVLSQGSMFDPVLVTDLFSKVKGKSSLAVLSAQTPVAFTGNKEFTFSMDSEIDVVAENGKKSNGGVTVEPVKIVPIKFEYGARVSDEFMHASEAEQLDILTAFNDGFARKVARGLDIAGFHGFNPRTSAASTVIGTNHFDSKVTQTVNFTAADPEANVSDAVAAIQGANGTVSGIAMGTTFAADLSKLAVNGVKQYPGFLWGANPGSVNGLPCDVNSTVEVGAVDHAIVGDFANAFKWGYAKEIPLEVIPYGDPDNTGVDLKGSNQVYLRSEVYMGWGILDASAFARIIKPAA